MALPVSIPNTFANATASIPLANLDANFTTIYNAVNGIGNGSESLANVTIAGGTIANVTISSGNATFTTANATTVDTTNIEVTNIKAKDGTAAGSIADSTGVVTLASSVLTTTDINGGTIDGTAIGGSTPAAGSFTTLAASSTATFAAGAVGTPAITTTGDTNTGIFFPAADTIGLTVGGVEAARLVSGLLSVPANSTAASAVRLFEDTDNGTNFVALQAAAAIASNVTFTLPAADGTNGQVIQTNGSGILSFASVSSLAPTTQVFTSGSGTYTTPAGCKAILVELVGGGGGGGASGANTGTAGGNTTFGTALLAANGGGGGQHGASIGGAAGAGGTASGGDINATGSMGCVGFFGAETSPSGGMGGNSFFGGAASGGLKNTAGSNASGFGSGGGGAGGNIATLNSAAGGGAGGYCRDLISAPSATYAYAVGALGNGGAAGSFVGGNGSAGIITVQEYY